MRYSKIHFFTIFIVLPVIFYSSCKPEQQHPIPEVYVNFTINLEDSPDFYFLLTPSSAAIVYSYDIGGAISLGFNNNGIIIYNNGDGEFYAFDCTCPHDLPENAAVDVSAQNGMATCPRCGSQYVFPSMGAPTTDGPSHWPLKEYNAYYNPNTTDLLVTN
jgi:hypothetical protein